MDFFWTLAGVGCHAVSIFLWVFERWDSLKSWKSSDHKQLSRHQRLHGDHLILPLLGEKIYLSTGCQGNLWTCIPMNDWFLWDKCRYTYNLRPMDPKGLDRQMARKIYSQIWKKETVSPETTLGKIKFGAIHDRYIIYILYIYSQIWKQFWGKLIANIFLFRSPASCRAHWFFDQICNCGRCPSFSSLNPSAKDHLRDCWKQLRFKSEERNMFQRTWLNTIFS